ncbi:hypothetical protein FVE85_5785 [Porphyridium purpureum]|uniref:Uncharacterized protein n=1 Tax=Porphyridium purpureum TaxID=35688 RepID=A0A5J4Z4J4_PORPP|nr:hypothetical protein FVE85_5785 [Porphyridium purpureum]|eukprot:POR9846..scf295_1
MTARSHRLLSEWSQLVLPPLAALQLMLLLLAPLAAVLGSALFACAYVLDARWRLIHGRSTGALACGAALLEWVMTLLRVAELHADAYGAVAMAGPGGLILKEVQITLAFSAKWLALYIVLNAHRFDSDKHESDNKHLLQWLRMSVALCVPMSISCLMCAAASRPALTSDQVSTDDLSGYVWTHALAASLVVASLAFAACRHQKAGVQVGLNESASSSSSALLSYGPQDCAEGHDHLLSNGEALALISLCAMIPVFSYLGSYQTDWHRVTFLDIALFLCPVGFGACAGSRRFSLLAGLCAAMSTCCFTVRAVLPWLVVGDLKVFHALHNDAVLLICLCLFCVFLVSSTRAWTLNAYHDTLLPQTSRENDSTSTFDSKLRRAALESFRAAHSLALVWTLNSIRVYLGGYEIWGSVRDTMSLVLLSVGGTITCMILCLWGFWLLGSGGFISESSSEVHAVGCLAHALLWFVHEFMLRTVEPRAWNVRIGGMSVLLGVMATMSSYHLLCAVRTGRREGGSAGSVAIEETSAFERLVIDVSLRTHLGRLVMVVPGTLSWTTVLIGFLFFQLLPLPFFLQGWLAPVDLLQRFLVRLDALLRRPHLGGDTPSAAPALESKRKSVVPLGIVRWISGAGCAVYLSLACVPALSDYGVVEAFPMYTCIALLLALSSATVSLYAAASIVLLASIAMLANTWGLICGCAFAAHVVSRTYSVTQTLASVLALVCGVALGLTVVSSGGPLSLSPMHACAVVFIIASSSFLLLEYFSLSSAQVQQSSMDARTLRKLHAGRLVMLASHGGALALWVAWECGLLSKYYGNARDAEVFAHLLLVASTSACLTALTLYSDEQAQRCWMLRMETQPRPENARGLRGSSRLNARHLLAPVRNLVLPMACLGYVLGSIVCIQSFGSCEIPLVLLCPLLTLQAGTTNAPEFGHRVKVAPGWSHKNAVLEQSSAGLDEKPYRLAVTTLVVELYVVALLRIAGVLPHSGLAMKNLASVFEYSSTLHDKHPLVDVGYELSLLVCCSLSLAHGVWRFLWHKDTGPNLRRALLLAPLNGVPLLLSSLLATWCLCLVALALVLLELYITHQTRAKLLHFI